MGAAKREAEAFEDMTVDLAKIAIATGAVRLDEEDGETLLTRCNANAERHAYARLTYSLQARSLDLQPPRCQRCNARHTRRSKICEPPRARDEADMVTVQRPLREIPGSDRRRFTHHK